MRVCVTGGSRGIGRAVAQSLTSAGYAVTILARQRAALDEALAAGVAAQGIAVDAADLDRLGAIVAEGRFDILVNNVGDAETGAFAKSDRALFQRMLDVNFMTTVEASRAALPYMTAQKFGRLINIASTAGLKGYPYVSAYVAAKHAVVGLTRALAVELARSGVTANAICPGYTDTDLVAASVEAIAARSKRSAAEARAHFESSNPMGRLMTPEEVAQTAVWLAHPQSGGVTGQCIAVAGGEI